MEEPAVYGTDEAPDLVGELNSFTEAMAIDPNNLDAECLKQATMASQYGFLLAQLTSDRDHVRRQIKVRRAEVEKEIRNDPEAYGVAKVTEAAVNAAIEAHPDIVLLERELIEKNYEVNVAQVAVDSVSSRKKLLECLIQLWTSSYFSTPRGEVGKAAERQSDVHHREHLGKALKARGIVQPTPNSGVITHGPGKFPHEADSSGNGVPEEKVEAPAAPRKPPARPASPPPRRGGGK